MRMSIFSFIVALPCLLFAQNNTLSQEEKNAGWDLLFDGTLTGSNGLRANWVNYQKNQPNTTSLTSTWLVNEQLGEMFITGNTNDIRTKNMYKDFYLKFDYKINGNQGLMYRTTLCGNSTWESAVEIAMDIHYSSPKHSPGDAYDLYIAKEKNFRQFSEANPWNEFGLKIIGDSVEHWQNGKYLLGFKFWSTGFRSAYNSSKWPNYPCFARPYNIQTQQISNTGYVQEGYLAIQSGHGGDLYLRNFKVLEFDNCGTGTKCWQDMICKDPNNPASKQPPCIVSVESKILSGEKLDYFAGNGYLKLNLSYLDYKYVEIYDVLGNLVNRMNEGKEIVELPLKPGLYFVRVSGKHNLLEKITVF